jgi:hypothetical protein
MLSPDGVISSLPVLVSFLAKDAMVAKLSPTGLSQPEDWGTWSAAKEVSLHFSFANPLPSSAAITLNFHPFVAGDHLQTFEFLWNGTSLGSQTYRENKDVSLSYDLSGSIAASNTLSIKVPNAAAPKSLGINDDTRELGIGIVSIEFSVK